MEEIVKALLHNWKEAVAIIVVIATVVGGWWSLKTTLKDIDKKVGDVDISLGTQTTKMTNVEGYLNTLSGAIRTSGSLSKLPTFQESAYGISKSPMRPTEKGTKLLEDSGFNGIYPKLKEKIFEKMDELGTPTLYDAEQNAYAALESLKKEPEMNRPKEYAVNNPSEPLELIFSVASWIIRDDYWENHEKKEK